MRKHIYHILYSIMVTLFVGVLLIVVDIPINMRAEKNHELLYLGFFSVSIAHGFAVYDKRHVGMKLMSIYQQADVQMYEDKKRIKETQMKPEEYYREWKKDK